MAEREPGTLDFEDKESWARAAIACGRRGEGDAALAALLVPGVLEKVVEIERAEGEQLTLEEV